MVPVYNITFVPLGKINCNPKKFRMFFFNGVIAAQQRKQKNVTLHELLACFVGVRTLLDTTENNDIDFFWKSATVVWLMDTC